LPRCAYFPFGEGQRVCIARPLALMELALVASTIAPLWQIVLEPGQELVPEPMNTIRPRGGLQMRVQRRF
jgi:cytochrome P450